MTHTPSAAPGGTPGPGVPLSQRPARFKIGVGLLILYPLLYLVIPIAPMLPLDTPTKLGLIAGVLAAAEGILLLGIACVGKEAYHAIKARLKLGRKKTKRSADGPAGRDATHDDA